MAETPSPRTATLPDFTPVPRQCDRSNGWKPEVQRAFIEALAETGSVKAACRRVGRADHGAYLLRRHPQAESFRAAWQAALDIGLQRIEDVAMDRAINGTEEPVYSYGKLVGTRTRYNDRLLMFMLRNRAPERFAGGGAARGLSALDKAQVERLRAEWLQEYLAGLRQEEDARVRALARRIEQMHRTWYGNLSPRARAAYRAFRRIEREDGVDWMLADGDRADESPEAAAAEYDETFAGDGRAKIKLKMEAEGWFVDDVLAEDAQPPAQQPEPPPDPPPQPPRPTPRIRTLKGNWD